MPPKFKFTLKSSILECKQYKQIDRKEKLFISEALLGILHMLPPETIESKSHVIKLLNQYILSNKLQHTKIGKRSLVHWPTLEDPLINIHDLHAKYLT